MLIVDLTLPTQSFMSLWRSNKPTVAKVRLAFNCRASTYSHTSTRLLLNNLFAQVHGLAVAGGSDIALCCDIVVMSDQAKIGYPPAR